MGNQHKPAVINLVESLEKNQKMLLEQHGAENQSDVAKASAVTTRSIYQVNSNMLLRMLERTNLDELQLHAAVILPVLRRLDPSILFWSEDMSYHRRLRNLIDDIDPPLTFTTAN